MSFHTLVVLVPRRATTIRPEGGDWTTTTWMEGGRASVSPTAVVSCCPVGVHVSTKRWSIFCEILLEIFLVLCIGCEFFVQ